MPPHSARNYCFKFLWWPKHRLAVMKNQDFSFHLYHNNSLFSFPKPISLTWAKFLGCGYWTGSQFWAVRGNEVQAGYPKGIHTLGFPPTVKKIDAAVFEKEKKKTYFFHFHLTYTYVARHLHIPKHGSKHRRSTQKHISLSINKYKIKKK